jgi:hypothetical protein
MALGLGPCSGITRTIKKPRVLLFCHWIKTMATDLSRSDRGYEKCYISDEKYGREDEEEVVNVGNEHESVTV